MLVRDVMTPTVVTVPVEDMLVEAVERMLDHRIGSVVVAGEGGPVGIVTEMDVLVAGRETGLPLDEISIAQVMSSPLVTIPPHATIRAAVERMREHEVKKLPVTDDFDVVGILTQQDVVYAHPDLVREAIELEERRRSWEDE